MWYHVLLPSGVSGYVREDNVKETGTFTGGGLAKVTVTAKDTNVRPLPLIQSDKSPVAKMNPGDTAVLLEKVNESGTYSWVRGPFTSAELLKSLQGKTQTPPPSPIVTLDVTKREPSGRATEIKANGQVLDVKYPDLFRSALGSLPSTLFDIVQTGSYTVRSADGTTAKKTGSSGAAVVSASGQHPCGRRNGHPERGRQRPQRRQKRRFYVRRPRQRAWPRTLAMGSERDG